MGFYGELAQMSLQFGHLATRGRYQLLAISFNGKALLITQTPGLLSDLEP